MPAPIRETGEQEYLRNQERDLQRWLVIILGLGLVGIGIAVWGLLRLPLEAWSLKETGRLIPPLIFGVIALLVLLNYYLAQKQAIIHGLQQVLIKQKIEAELNRELALIDPVTEVYNRRYLRAVFSKEISRVRRYGMELAVMMIDITGFRRVNDSLGQAGGDVVLRQIAHVIQTRVRNSDTIVRFGGDEFLLVLPDTHDVGLQTLTLRLKEAVRDWARRSSMTDFGLRFAIGTARYTPEQHMDEILAQAEQRMLQDRQAEALGRPLAATASASYNGGLDCP